MLYARTYNVYYRRIFMYHFHFSVIVPVSTRTELRYTIDTMHVHMKHTKWNVHNGWMFMYAVLLNSFSLSRSFFYRFSSFIRPLSLYNSRFLFSLNIWVSAFLSLDFGFYLHREKLVAVSRQISDGNFIFRRFVEPVRIIGWSDCVM